MKNYQIEFIFLSERRHYDSFPVFTFIRCRLVFDWFSALRNSEIQVKTWVFSLKGRENLNFKSLTWIKFGLNLKLDPKYKFEFVFKLEIFEVFFNEVDLEFNLEGFLYKKMFGFPLLSGVRGLLFPGGFK